jgi:hypothetical protein
LRNNGLAAQQKQQALANQIAAPRIWKIDRKTGDVSYALNGQVSVIDRGRIVTVLNQDKAAVLFGLEMAIQKYGSRIACDGSVEWKRMVTKTAAQQRHLRPIHRPGDATRPAFSTTSGESAPTPAGKRRQVAHDRGYAAAVSKML